MEENKVQEGILSSTLKQNFKQLKESRIETMLEKSEKLYRRTIEDIAEDIDQCDRDMEDAILDVLPINAGQGINPNMFDASKMMEQRVKSLVARREKSIMLGIYYKDYVKLFGEYPNFEKIKSYLED